MFLPPAVGLIAAKFCTALHPFQMGSGRVGSQHLDTCHLGQPGHLSQEIIGMHTHPPSTCKYNLLQSVC